MDFFERSMVLWTLSLSTGGPLTGPPLWGGPWGGHSVPRRHGAAPAAPWLYPIPSYSLGFWLDFGFWLSFTRIWGGFGLISG